MKPPIFLLPQATDVTIYRADRTKEQRRADPGRQLELLLDPFGVRVVLMRDRK